jgi:hypothetical protein
MASPQKPRCPQCFRADNVRLLAAAADAESPRDVWECSACARVFVEPKK